MQMSIEHNLSDQDLCNVMTGIAVASGIEAAVIENLQKARSACDDTAKEPKHPATRVLYYLMKRALRAAGRDIERYMGAIRHKGELLKAVGTPDLGNLTPGQLRRLGQAITDRYGFIAAQVQSIDYEPPADMLDRWKQLGLVSPDITPATFAATIPAEMHFIRNAYLMGKFIQSVESGKSYREVMEMVRYTPLLAPDVHAIAIAEQQTALYLQDNAADLATRVGQLAIKQRNETIRQMAIDYHAGTLPRTILDRDKKEARGIATPERPVDNWRQFASELHHTMEDKSRDWDRVAYYEITDAQKQGAARALLEDGDVNKYVYKSPMPTACAQCQFAYLLPDGRTPRIFRLSEMITTGTNIGRKPRPVRAGKVSGVPRTDGAEMMQAVVGLLHPWCQCGGPYPVTGIEPWLTENQKRMTKGELAA